MPQDLFTLMGRIAIDSGNSEAEINRISGAAENLSKELNATETTTKNTANKTSNRLNSWAVFTGNMLTTVVNKTGALFGKVFKTGIDYNADVETATTHLTTLLKGDTEAAEELVKKLEKLATLTPLGTSGLISNAKELLGYGLKLEDIVPTLEMLGNFAFGDQTKLDGIVRAYGQIYSQQVLMAQDANQLVNQDVPIFQILSEHVGGRYEGLTRGDMIGDKNNPVLFEDMHAAMVAATSEGGKFYNAMFNTLDNYQGQLNKLGEEGEQTAGKLTKSFFETLTMDVLPKLSESLSTFNTWINENQEGIKAFSDTIGKIATNAFDSLLAFFQWTVENKEAATVALGAIAAVIGAIAAHSSPLYLVVGALAAIVTNWNTIVDWIQPAIDAWDSLIGRIDAAVVSLQTFLGLNYGSGTHVSVDGVTHGGGAGRGFGSANGSHANGLDYVPFDGYRAILHQGESVLTKREANDWRNGGADIATAMREAVSGMQIVLDSGVLVGQLAPRIDEQLGTIASRRGRG